MNEQLINKIVSFPNQDKAKQEEILWTQFINGDDTAYGLIYKKYVRILYQYGIQFTNNEDLVKDAIHDLFVKLYANRATLRTSANVKFYLFVSLKNCLHNIFKKEISFLKIDEYDLSNVSDYAAEAKVTESLDQEEKKQQIYTLLDELTDRQREVIYYRFIQELPLDEICILMDMNYQSVQNLIQRSLKKMRNSSSSYYFIEYLIITRLISMI